jgi:hypothetical protein
MVLTALAVGAMTSKGAGEPLEQTWSVIVVDPDTQAEFHREQRAADGGTAAAPPIASC